MPARLTCLLRLAYLVPLAVAAQSPLPVNLQPPTVEWMNVVERANDPTQYNHDSALVCHQGEWILGWNANLDPKEGVPGQKNYFARATSWDGFRQRPHVPEFQSADWSVNPVGKDGIEWHPTFIQLGGRLECWWFATSSPGFPRTVGYKSVWDDRARKWTNFKIQLRPGGKVGFSSRVETEEEQDRVTINGVSYVPMPLATPITGNKGLLVMPMIISPGPKGGQLGGPNEVVLFTSEDGGKNWQWSQPVPKAPGPQRGSAWEPWMTWDGKAYHLFYRNFGAVLPGKGYSYTTTSDLRRWPAADDAPLDMMPMRGETVTDGSNWYVALVERPQIGNSFWSAERRALTLYRARNGVDWQPVAPLLPTQVNAFYCWLYLRGDGYLYFSTTTSPNIAVGRIKLPDPSQYYITPERRLPAAAVGRPWADGEKITFAGSQFLRAKAELSPGPGFSFAALCRTGSVSTGITLDFLRADKPSSIWGYGLMPILDCEWRVGLPGWTTEIKTVGLTPRTGELAFVGVSFDETDKVIRIVRRNRSDAWETKEWHAQALFIDRLPEDGTVTVINGLDYHWRANAVAPRDVAIAETGMENLRRLATTVAKQDPLVRGPSVTAMYSTAAKAVRAHLVCYFENTPAPLRVDGRILRSDGNTFDVPRHHFTLNGNNRTDDPAAPTSVAGMELWRFGLWNRRLTTDDFKALYNAVAPIVGRPVEATASAEPWNSADIFLDPTRPEGLPEGVDWRGHIALATSEGVTVYGDGAAAVEVPGQGDWTWEAEFRFDETEGRSWDLLTVGDKFSLGRLEVAREPDSTYALYRGPTKLCPVKPNEWIPLRIRYKAGNADLELPASAMLRVSARPLLRLGRFFSDRVDPPEINRSLPHRTEWRAIRLTAAPGAR